MLKKMLLQGLAAAVLIGGAAVVYAQVRDNGYLSAPQTKTSHSPGAKEGAKERTDRKSAHDQDRAPGGQHAGHDD
ncbi:MAG: hypothetical protein K2X72_11735 [Reyranella sp.]|nr:hypothetical protein [Reyranella sp.]